MPVPMTKLCACPHIVPALGLRLRTTCLSPYRPTVATTCLSPWHPIRIPRITAVIPARWRKQRQPQCTPPGPINPTAGRTPVLITQMRGQKADKFVENRNTRVPGRPAMAADLLHTGDRQLHPNYAKGCVRTASGNSTRFSVNAA